MTGLEASRIRVVADGTLLIDDVAVRAEPGTLTALIGPNGAGKSTLLRALAAVERPAEGEVVYGDEDLLRMPRRQRARLATLVEQDAQTELSLSVAEVVELGLLPRRSLWSSSELRDREVVSAALERVGMSGFADRDITSLSGGERQRVMLARALAQDTPLLLLDEPTNHLDVRAQLATLRLLRGLADEGRTVVAALHDLGLAAAWSQRIVVLSDGRVRAAGPTAQVLSPELIRDVYGVDAVVLEHPVTGAPLIAVSPLPD